MGPLALADTWGEELAADLDVGPVSPYGTHVVKVVQRGRFRVYVYAEGGAPHHLAHCHVQWSDGATSVALRTLRVLDGDPLPPAARDLLGEHIDELYAAWNALNPGRRIE